MNGQKKRLPPEGEVSFWEWVKIALYVCWLALIAPDKKR